MLEGLFLGSIEDAAARQQSLATAKLEQLATSAPAALNALDFLCKSNHIKILAEVKRASPSRGDLASIADPANLAQTYASAGASAISVLTEQRKFKGSLEDLVAVRAAVSVPILRKDFIANEYQILEARAAGADIVLLIVAGLDLQTIARLKQFTEQLGMLAFVETHSAEEVKVAVDLGTKMIGVNARDLSTFETDRDLFAKIVHLIPEETIKVAESAVRNLDDIRHYRAAGADVALVGEALVAGDAKSLLEQFTAV
ncbi:MAG: indole-3-glycerol phosphate synthase TrpC [Rhodoluna sp.]|nr:indole-3-glycerol phosphate synthase TrpC [Rhodoluna sp.]MBP6186777.1 indole-3-glycerol phosphate synthase TrpC [Rhodoluna sp.]